MRKKIGICFAGSLLALGLVSCKAEPSFVKEEYLSSLALKSGIGQGRSVEEDLSSLHDWGIIENEDLSSLKEPMTYGFLGETVDQLLDLEKEPLEYLKEEGLINEKTTQEDKADRETAEKIIDHAVDAINHPLFEHTYTQKLKDTVKKPGDVLENGDIFLYEDTYRIFDENKEEKDCPLAEYEDVYERLEVEAKEFLDFEKADVIPYGEILEDTSYINEYYTLLTSNDSHVFHKNGFRISYSLNPSGIDLHVSKEVKGFNIFFDASLHNVKAGLKWKEEKDDLKNCFFTLKFNTTEKLGVSDGRYGNYHLKFKDLDESSFQSLLHSLIEPLKQDEEASLTLCRVKIPFADLPGVNIVMDLKLKLYASGKSEFVLTNSHELGFETKNGKIRFINQNDHDLNCILQASAKGVLGVNITAETLGIRLADVEVDAGARGLVRSTLHYVKEDGEMDKTSSKLPYSVLSELSYGNPDVLVCGDLSLHYILDLHFNTAGTKMNRFGFSRSYSILNEEDQIFKNLHHIENGHFVESCTRRKKDSIVQMQEVRSDKITLSSYAEVLHQGKSYQIIVKALPEGYGIEDLSYESEDPSIAYAKGEEICAVSPGSVRIKVSTNDGKYVSYVNVLVSTQ